MARMVWSIYKDTGDEPWEVADAAFYWDEDIQASARNRLKFFKDGEHEIFFGRYSTIISVRNGKFDIDRVCQDIKKIVDQDEYWGVYIEGFSKSGGQFQVIVGS